MSGLLFFEELRCNIALNRWELTRIINSLENKCLQSDDLLSFQVFLAGKVGNTRNLKLF
jgi:hypothetical protein